MTANQPLTGVELVNCAQANAKQGAAIAAKLCGYGDDLDRFGRELKQACQSMGIEIAELSDLIQSPNVAPPSGRAIAPETDSDL